MVKLSSARSEPTPWFTLGFGQGSDDCLGCRSTDRHVHPAVIVRILISSLLTFPQVCPARSSLEIALFLANPSDFRSTKRAYFSPTGHDSYPVGAKLSAPWREPTQGFTLVLVLSSESFNDIRAPISWDRRFPLQAPSILAVSSAFRRGVDLRDVASPKRFDGRSGRQHSHGLALRA